MCAASYSSAQAALNDYGDYIASSQPYKFTETLSLEQDGATVASATFNGSISAAPEPSTWLLLIAGVGLTGAALRRRSSTTIAKVQALFP